MGKSVVVLGSQWGDEGKGKIVDLLSSHADWVIRYQGGHNAGHTLVIKDQVIALSLIPSGILHPNKKCLIGNGVVVAPSVLWDEIEKLKTYGVNALDKLLISSGCPMLLPTHQALDKAREHKLGKRAIGTTGRGIGPCYEDFISRRGLKLDDWFDEINFKEKLYELMSYQNFVLEKYYEAPTVNIDETWESLLELREKLAPIIVDGVDSLYQAHQDKQNILFEGAQGALLDIQHGTYPFVTSSTTLAGGVCGGAGMGPKHIDTIIGVTKAYCTRVGSGPMPTELNDSIGKGLAKRGHEFGTVTGRPRRCGWLDMVALKKSVFLNSLTGLCLTKLDILDGMDEVKICVGYRLDNKIVDIAPMSIYDLNRCEPVYEVLPGWQESTFGVTSWDDLPVNARNYVSKIESLLDNVNIDILSTGPERNETIIMKHPFE